MEDGYEALNLFIEFRGKYHEGLNIHVCYEIARCQVLIMRIVTGEVRSGPLIEMGGTQLARRSTWSGLCNHAIWLLILIGKVRSGGQVWRSTCLQVFIGQDPKTNCINM